jgi:putative NADPH-quinone reductase
MTARRIAVLQGHPDPAGQHFCQALAAAYVRAALAAGHEVRVIAVAQLDFPLLRTRVDWETQPVPPGLSTPSADIAWADHLVIVFPLWLGTMPALLKGFFEQVLRIPTFGGQDAAKQALTRPLHGKSVRIAVTMGMPALIFRWYFRSHGLKVLERNILAFVGAGPIRSSVIGLVEGPAARRERWLAQMADFGRAAR